MKGERLVNTSVKKYAVDKSQGTFVARNGDCDLSFAFVLNGPRNQQLQTRNKHSLPAAQFPLTLEDSLKTMARKLSNVNELLKLVNNNTICCCDKRRRGETATNPKKDHQENKYPDGNELMRCYEV